MKKDILKLKAHKNCWKYSLLSAILECDPNTKHFSCAKFLVICNPQNSWVDHPCDSFGIMISRVTTRPTS